MLGEWFPAHGLLSWGYQRGEAGCRADRLGSKKETLHKKRQGTYQKKIMCIISVGILDKYGMAEAIEIVSGKKPKQAVPADWVGEFDDEGNAAFHLPWEEGNPLIDPFKKGYRLLRRGEIWRDS